MRRASPKCFTTADLLFYRHQRVRADFPGGQITSDAGLLPLRAFDERHHLTRDLAALLSDPREDERLRHDSLELLRQRIYQTDKRSLHFQLSRDTLSLQFSQDWRQTPGD